MGLLGKIIKTGIDVVTTPVDVVQDIFTMVGASEGEEKPYTIQKLEKIGRDVKEVVDELEDL